MDVHFFGSDNSLLGVHHAPKQESARAVVICPPIGQEYLRTHWTLRLVANQLSRRGIHAFRFDWSGFGDSQKSPKEIHSLKHWHTDLETAIERLKDISGVTSVMLLGLRAGAGLAADVGTKRDDVNGLIAWEPVLDGFQMLQEWRSIQKRMLDLWHCKMNTLNDEDFEEILGWVYQRGLVQEIETWKCWLDQVDLPQLVIESRQTGRKFSHQVPGLQKVEWSEEPSAWSDLSVLETAWLRPEANRLIVTRCIEMFDRLGKRGLLSVKRPKNKRANGQLVGGKA